MEVENVWLAYELTDEYGRRKLLAVCSDISVAIDIVKGKGWMTGDGDVEGPFPITRSIEQYRGMIDKKKRQHALDKLDEDEKILLGLIPARVKEFEPVREEKWTIDPRTQFPSIDIKYTYQNRHYQVLRITIPKIYLNHEDFPLDRVINGLCNKAGYFGGQIQDSADHEDVIVLTVHANKD